MQGYRTWKIKNDIPEDLWLKVRAICITRKIKVAQWLEEAVREKLEREKEQYGEYDTKNSTVPATMGD